MLRNNIIMIIASLKNYRQSPRKMRGVANLVRGKSVENALNTLNFLSKKASDPLYTLLQSAIANAKNNFGLSQDTLTFKEISVTKGIVFKRYRAVSRGRVHPILKRTSHIKVVLKSEQKKEVSQKEVSQVSKVPEVSQVSKVEKKNEK